MPCTTTTWCTASYLPDTVTVAPYDDAASGCPGTNTSLAGTGVATASSRCARSHCQRDRKPNATITASARIVSPIHLRVVSIRSTPPTVTAASSACRPGRAARRRAVPDLGAVGDNDRVTAWVRRVVADERVWLVAALVIAARLVVAVPGRFGDLAVYRWGGGAVWTDGALYAATYTGPGADHALPFTYPPFAAMLFWPLSWVPLDVLARLWVVLSLVLLARVCLLLVRATGSAPGPSAATPSSSCARRCSPSR